jgi:ferredoxin--NADP+ reductase
MKILTKEILSQAADASIVKMEVLAPDIVKKVLPGQFVVLMVTKEGERIPLTIVDKDTDKGIITLIFQQVGATTRLLGSLKPGDSIYALVGPLGHATQIKNYGRVILVGGGVGIAEIYPVAKALKEAGNHLAVILGARSKELLILEKELKEVCDKFFITTDDGSAGRKGFTSDVLAELLEKDKYDLVYAVGPIPMMRKVSAMTKESHTNTIVSLNALMVDATGMCGCCRVNVGGEIKFSCVDGPEFNGQAVHWDELTKRNRMYLEQEKHLCNLYKAA